MIVARVTSDGDRFDVVAIGETMVQLVPQNERLAEALTLHVGVGGAESNTASYLAAAGHRVSWISAVGDDPFGTRIVEQVASFGVDVSRVVLDASNPTGVYFKDPVAGSGTSVFYYRRGSAASRLSVDRVELPDLAGVRIVHMSGITMALSREGFEFVAQVGVRARDAGALFSFDVNYRPALWSVQEAAPELLRQARASDLVFVGLDEAHVLWGCESPHELSELMPRTLVVVKDGDVGATSFAPSTDDMASTETFVPARAIEVLEPVGAGDAFAAGYLHALLADMSEEARLDTGHRFAVAALRSLHDVATVDEVNAVVAGLAHP